MMSKITVFLFVLGALSVSGLAQTRSITNFDLEKYKTQRVAAEKDLRDNYEKLGFSSPEERAKRDEERKKENAELAARFERERLEQEAADAQARQAAASYATQPQYYNSDPNYSVVYGQGGYYYSPRFRDRVRPGTRYQQPLGYVGGGMLWPAPTTTRQPILSIGPPNRPRH
jgi:hypothetical protein